MHSRFFPGVDRSGGGTASLEALVDALNQARGTAYDTSIDGVVYAENEALARMLWVAWEQNQRFANQFDPARMTDMLPRWEKILGLYPDPTATASERRAAVAERWARVGVEPVRDEMRQRIQAVLGNIFVAYENIGVAQATQWWPGGTPNPNAPWYSTTARVLVKVARPATMTLGEFWARISRIHRIFDDLLPSWATWDWYVDPPVGTGFVLDDENNLDHYRFD